MPNFYELSYLALVVMSFLGWVNKNYENGCKIEHWVLQISITN